MKKVLMLCALGIAAFAASSARADVFSFSFTGPDVSNFNHFSFSGSGTLDASYSGVLNVWDITNISGTVTTDTYTGSHSAPTSNTFDIDSLLSAGAFEGNDNLLFSPAFPLLNGGYYFDNNGVSFSLVGSSNDVNLDTTGFFIVLDGGTDGQHSEVFNDETVCWQGPGDPSPTPEPGSLALLGTSILGGAGLLRRRFRV